MDAYDKLLSHLNGIDESTTFIDEAGHTIVANGDVQIDTALSKFGGASGLFDGVGDYLNIADSNDWDFGTDDFTIDFWIYPTSFNAYNGIISTSPIYVSGGWVVYVTSDGIVRLTCDGAYTDLVTSGNLSLTLNEWNHVALVRKGIGSTDMNLYINGVAGDSPNFGNVTLNSYGLGLYIGRFYTDSDVHYINGNLDELRISKGVARWTSDFTPPTEEYEDSSSGTSVDGDGTIVIDGTSDVILGGTEQVTGNGHITISGISDVIESTVVTGNGQITISGESDYYNIQRTLQEITINTDIRFGIQELVELTLNTDIRFSKLEELILNTDIRFSNNTYTDSYLRGVDDFEIKLDSVSLTDVDIEASSISYKLGTAPSEARLVLARRHDNPDYTLADVYSQITNENKIEIYDGIRKIFTGYITKLDCSSETDTITITAQDARYKLARTSQLQLNRGYFDKEKRDQLLDDSKTIYYTNQTALKYVLDQAVSNGYIVGYNTNILADLNISLDGQELTDTYDNCIDNLLKEVLTADWYIDENEIIKFIKKGQETIHNINLASLAKQRTIYDAIISDVSLDKEHSFYLSAININYGKQINSRYWIYTSYDLPSETFYWTTKKDIAKTYFSFQTYQSAVRYIGEQVTNYGYWTATQAVVLPWWMLQVNTKNNEEAIAETVLGSGEVKKTLNYSQYGIKVADSYYEEKTEEDGSVWLYKIHPENYDHTNYVNDIAKFEYYQNNKLLTTANVSIFLDTYLFYNIKIGNRINLDNTISAGIYKNNNEFPLTIESIDLSFKDRTMRMGLTNFGGNYYKRTVSYNSGIINEESETKVYKKISPIVAGQGLD